MASSVISGQPQLCPGCGTPQFDNFCAHCGEKRISAHDYSIVHFFEHALEVFTHFDFRSLRGIKVLATQPGELTRAYLGGRRKQYIGPIQLFIILNVIFALIGGTTFRTPLDIQEHDRPFRNLKRAMAASAIERSHRTREEFAHEFDRNAATQGKSWVFAMIPAFALCLAALYGFRRYYFEHLVFATHFMAFFMMFILASSVVVGIALWALRVTLSPSGLDYRVSSIILVGLVAYLYAALRRTYDDSRPAAILRAVVLGALIVPLLPAYRFLLFFVTLKTMH